MNNIYQKQPEIIFKLINETGLKYGQAQPRNTKTGQEPKIDKQFSRYLRTAQTLPNGEKKKKKRKNSSKLQ